MNEASSCLLFFFIQMIRGLISRSPVNWSLRMGYEPFLQTFPGATGAIPGITPDIPAFGPNRIWVHNIHNLLFNALFKKHAQKKSLKYIYKNQILYNLVFHIQEKHIPFTVVITLYVDVIV